jgi:hypothetical protein
LVLIPVPWAFDVVEIPSLLLVACWFLLQAIGSESALTETMLTGAPPLFGPIGGGLAGALAVLVLRRPERMRVEWMDRQQRRVRR